MSSPEDRSENNSHGGGVPIEGGAGMRARLLVKNGTALVKSLRSEVESRVRGAAKRLPAAITSPVQLLIRTSREFATTTAPHMRRRSRSTPSSVCSRYYSGPA